MRPWPRPARAPWRGGRPAGGGAPPPDPTPPVAMPAHEAKEREEPEPELALGIPLLPPRLVDRLHKARPGVVDAGEVEVLLRPEVRVDHRLRHPGARRDLVHRRAVVAALAEARHSPAEHLRF